MRVTSGPGRGCFRGRDPGTYELRAYVGKLKIALFFVRKRKPGDPRRRCGARTTGRYDYFRRAIVT